MGQLESVYIDGIDDIDNDSILHGDLSLERIAKVIKDGDVRNIVVMSGAGISVAAGIPDFRSPGTGLYYNLGKFNLPSPESMFDIEYFRENPDAFYSFVMVRIFSSVLYRNSSQNNISPPTPTILSRFSWKKEYSSETTPKILMDSKDRQEFPMEGLLKPMAQLAPAPVSTASVPKKLSGFENKYFRENVLFASVED